MAGISAVALADAMIDTWFFCSSDGENVDKSETNVDNLEILDSSWKRAKEMAAAILQEQMAADTGDVNENAVQFVVDWALQNKIYFGEKAMGTCLGVFSESGNTVYIFPSALNQALTKAGYSARKTLKYMADNGLITSQERSDHKGKTYQVVKRFDNRLCKFVEFFIGRISEKEDALDIDEEDEVQSETIKKPQYGQESLMDRNGFVTVSEGYDLPFN